MVRPELGRYVLIPVLGFAVFTWALQALKVERGGILFSEYGAVELGTAVCFLAACGLAIHLTFAAKGVIPPRYRALYVLFACVALFVSLEEVSYGQHIFGWQSPKFFVQQNTKHEVNLHNLYEDRLSDILRQVANIVFPAICIALPLAAFAQRKQDDPRHWAFFLLPKFELVTIALIAQATPPLDRLSKSLVGVSMLVRAGELQELLWSIAIVMYAWTVHQRVFLQHASSRIGAMGSSQPGPTYLKKGILTQ